MIGEMIGDEIGEMFEQVTTSEGALWEDDLTDIWDNDLTDIWDQEL